jgi:hypothetical protein
VAKKQQKQVNCDCHKKAKKLDKKFGTEAGHEGTVRKRAQPVR